MNRRASPENQTENASLANEDESQSRKRRRESNTTRKETPPRPQMTEEIRGILTCPISHEIMRDPVSLDKSGHVFDRESICSCLLQNPTRCPLTGTEYGVKLDYAECTSIRKFLTLYMGDEAYQKYNDSSFRKEYEDVVVVGSTSLVEPDASTLHNLGMKYVQEDQNHEHASHYFALAANKGHVNAQVYLALLYENGNGVEQDYKKARHYYELAANQGHVDAEFNLGVLYDNGNGVEQDYDKARHWYEQCSRSRLSPVHNAILVFCTRMERALSKTTRRLFTIMILQLNKALPRHNSILVISTRMVKVSNKILKKLGSVAN